jgi:hypothetical protein
MNSRLAGCPSATSARYAFLSGFTGGVARPLRLNDSEFGRRMCGTGEYVGVIGRVFVVFARRHGLGGGRPPYDCSRFRLPVEANGPGRLL